MSWTSSLSILCLSFPIWTTEPTLEGVVTIRGKPGGPRPAPASVRVALPAGPTARTPQSGHGGRCADSQLVTLLPGKGWALLQQEGRWLDTEAKGACALGSTGRGHPWLLVAPLGSEQGCSALHMGLEGGQMEKEAPGGAHPLNPEAPAAGGEGREGACKAPWHTLCCPRGLKGPGGVKSQLCHLAGAPRMRC